MTELILEALSVRFFAVFNGDRHGTDSVGSRYMPSAIVGDVEGRTKAVEIVSRELETATEPHPFGRMNVSESIPIPEELDSSLDGDGLVREEVKVVSEG